MSSIRLSCRKTKMSKPVLLKFEVVEFDSKPLLRFGGCKSHNLIKLIDHIDVQSFLKKIRWCTFRGFPGLWKINLDETVRPVVSPCRRVSLMLKEKLKNALDKLENEKIIAKVEYPTDWVINLVIVEKKNAVP